MHAVDFSPLLEPALQIAGAVLAALIGALVTRGLAVLKISIDAGQREALHQAIARGVTLATAKVGAVAAGRMTLDVRNEVLAEAMTYVIKTSPGAAAHFGLDAAKLGPLVEAHLAKALGHA